MYINVTEFNTLLWCHLESSLIPLPMLSEGVAASSSTGIVLTVAHCATTE